MPAQRTELAQGRVRPNSFPTRHTATSSRGTGRPVIPQLPLQLATQPRLASAPPMTRVVRTGENAGSTIMYPRQPPPFQQQYQQQQQPPYPHCYPVKALMPIQRMPQVPSGAMQQLPIAGQWSVQMNRQQPQAVGSFPVTWVQVPGPTGMVPMAVIQPHPAGFSQPAAVLSPTAYLNIPPSVRVPQLGRAPQPPSHRRIEPDPQRTAVPLSYELSTKDRVYFTQSNKPGLLVSAFQDDPHCLDSAEQEVGCLARHQEVRWIFSWPGYEDKQKVTRVSRGFVLKDLALDLCEAIDELMAEVAQNGDRSSMAQKWTLGKKGIRRNKIWLISFGRLSSNLWWTPEWEAQLDI